MPISITNWGNQRPFDRPPSKIKAEGIKKKQDSGLKRPPGAIHRMRKGHGEDPYSQRGGPFLKVERIDDLQAGF
jgi:hypothetical protein